MGSDRRWAVSDQRLLHPPRTAAHDHSYLGHQPPRAQNLLGDPGRGKACQMPGHPPSRHRPTCVPEGDEVLPGFKANKPPFSGERGRCRRQAVESRNIHFRTFGPIGITERLAVHGRHCSRALSKIHRAWNKGLQATPGTAYFSAGSRYRGSLIGPFDD